MKDQTKTLISFNDSPTGGKCQKITQTMTGNVYDTVWGNNGIKIDVTTF